MSEGKTHFGYQQVPEGEKVRRVGEVFRSVASNYDLMNDLMSMGLHRYWKRFTIEMSGVRPGQAVLDVASGSGDLAAAFAKRVGAGGRVIMTDINEAMLRVGRDKLIDRGLFAPLAICDAEKLPFPDGMFDAVSVAFGLRNMTHKDRALAEMTRVLKPGGRVLVLEFSRPWKPPCRRTTRTRSPCCRCLASMWRATRRLIAISPNRFACTRTRRRSSR
jgi:ubiquinone/menaquinone biosynthesis methyltransferases